MLFEFVVIFRFWKIYMFFWMRIIFRLSCLWICGEIGGLNGGCFLCMKCLGSVKISVIIVYFFYGLGIKIILELKNMF